MIEYPPVRRTSDAVLITVMICIVLATLVAMAKPAWAIRIALICLLLAAAAAVAWWLASAYSRTIPERRSIDTSKPPDADDEPRPGPPPLAVSELQHPHGVAGLSSQGLRYLQFVATERLWANHQLNLAYDPHRRQIQAQVSPALWSAIGGTTTNYVPQVPLANLLHEIEAL